MATGLKFQKLKKSCDYTPHEVFAELKELHQNQYGGLEWKEMGRWVKYEEEVELISNRWRKPQVSVLNFGALFSLRKGLERGALLLDLNENDLPKIVTRVVEEMISSHQIPSHQKDSVHKLLLLNHKHVKETFNPLRRASRFAVGHDEEHHFPESVSPNLTNQNRRSSVRKSLANIFKPSVHNVQEGSLYEKDEIRNTLAQLELNAGSEGKEFIVNLDLKKRLADDCEAFACLVGAVDFLLQPALAFVRLAEGTKIENFVEVPIPIRFIFILLGPYESGIDYREIGRSISTLMVDKYFQESIYKLQSRDQILSAINDFLNASIIFPPLDWKNNELFPIDGIKGKTRDNLRKFEELKAKKMLLEKQEPVKQENTELMREKPIIIKAIEESKPPRDPLKREGKLFYGVIQDIKLRYPMYISDITDGINPQVLSSCIFIFFAALSPAITFGGIYGQKTDKLMGVGETLLATSINGIIFALFGAQPILIIGATGPLMVFDLSLLKFCKSMDIDFLSIRLWIGVWTVVFGFLFSAFEGIAVVKKFTKFTEELYATLICTIFIVGAFENIVDVFIQHPLIEPPCMEELNETYAFDDIILGTQLNKTVPEDTSEKLKNQPNTALLSLCLMFATFSLAMKLKKFRNSKYLGRSVRRALGDFGVPISMFLFVLLAYFISGVYTEKLGMPAGLQPSNAAVRGWIINPFGVQKPLPFWWIFASAPAALLLFILFFLEGNICQLIVSKPERCMKKGTGFHLDLFLTCIINAISGVIGAPFMSPAVVRTITHMSSLTIVSDKFAPGESPKIVGCIEQRISSFTVALLIGVSVMLYTVLNLVPNAVLLGVFLYMGVSALAGIQFYERTILFVMPVKYHPSVSYVRNVKTSKMHIYTAIQIFLLAMLWGVKQSPAALGVPFILICLIPIRLFILPCIFTPRELIALDGANQEEADKDEEPDFYETAHALPTQIEDK